MLQICVLEMVMKGLPEHRIRQCNVRCFKKNRYTNLSLLTLAHQMYPLILQILGIRYLGYFIVYVE